MKLDTFRLNKVNNNTLGTKTNHIYDSTEASENNCYRRLLHAHYTTDTTNVEIHWKVAEHIGKYGTLLDIVKKRQLRWFGLLVGAKETLANTLLQSKFDGRISQRRSASNLMAGRCKGMDRAELE